MSPEVLVQKMNWGWDSNTLSLIGSRQIEAEVGISGWGYPKRLFLEMDGGTCILLEWDVRISCGCDSHCFRNRCKFSSGKAIWVTFRFICL